MDKEQKALYIRVRLEAARNDLDDARHELNAQRLRIAVNRAYYAVFHVASAALAWQDVIRAKHSGVESSVGEFLVKKKIIEPEYFAIYRRAREAREAADYRPWMKALTEVDAREAVADAERFVQRLERYLKEVGAI